MILRGVLIALLLCAAWHHAGAADVGGDALVVAGDSTLPLAALRNANIPLLIITTIDGEEPTFDVVESSRGQKAIANATHVPARMCMMLGQDTIYDSGEYVDDESGLTIKIRGNSSAISPLKKPYKLKLQTKADLLLRGDDDTYKDKDWVLLTNEYKLSNHMIGLVVSRFMGFPWTPACEFVNVVMNGTYRGIYLLTEQVKRNPDCRINVDKKTGYIFEYDPYWWNEDLYFDSKFSFKYTFKYPDSDDVTLEQLEYIQAAVREAEASLTDSTYPNYLDIPSFALWVLTHDLLGTYDAAGSNIFISKYDSTEGSLLKMETPWDFDTIEQVEDDWARIHDYSEFYYNYLFANTNATFTREYKSQWAEKSDVVVAEILLWLDELLASDLPASIDYYSTIDKIVSEKDYSSFEDELEEHRAWFTQRQAWLDESIPSIVDTKVSAPLLPSRATAYDTQGRVATAATRGIVIADGKKVVKK